MVLKLITTEHVETISLACLAKSQRYNLRRGEIGGILSGSL